MEAIKQAAAEAARAAHLSMLEREAAALREATQKQAEALRWRLEAEGHLQMIAKTKRTAIKNAIITGAACLFGGVVVGLISRK